MGEEEEEEKTEKTKKKTEKSLFWEGDLWLDWVASYWLTTGERPARGC